MDQEHTLKDAKNGIKENSYYMKMALESQNIKDAMKRAKSMLSELRITNISPKEYYMLFMDVFDELMLLEQGFREEYKRKKGKFSKLYERVQYSDEILPRLYLMVTAGSVLIDTHEMTASAVILDLKGMLKGVQHPFRGLFLRYYFLKMIKNKIPDGNEPEDIEKIDKEFGSIENIIDMLLENLDEMNKLWVRINRLFSDKKRRKQERADLKITVGENLVRLSMMESIEVNIYKTKVLPQLLEHICSTGDKLSQQYLMDCIIQVFPDEFHIQTLDLYLTATQKLNKKVDLKQIYIKLMERFATYFKENHPSEDANSPEVKDMHFIYEKFRDSIYTIVRNTETISDKKFKLHKLLELQAAFINFCVHTYPDKVEYIDQILNLSVILCEKVPAETYKEKDFDCIVDILTYPLEKMSIVVLNLSEYPKLMNYLPLSRRKQVAIKIVEAILNSKTYLILPSIVSKLMGFINPLLEFQHETLRVKASELEREQSLISRLLHLVVSHDPRVTLEMLRLFEHKFIDSPVEWKRFTIPSLITNYCKLGHFVLTLRSLHPSQGEAPVAEEVEEEPTTPLVEALNAEDGEHEQQIQLQEEVQAPTDENEAEGKVTETPVDAPESVPKQDDAPTKKEEKIIAVVSDQLKEMNEYIQKNYDYRASATYLTEEERQSIDIHLEQFDFDFQELFDNLFMQIEELSIDYPDVCIRLYLQLALLISDADPSNNYDEIQYEVCSEALELYQDEISDSNEKVIIPHLQKEIPFGLYNRNFHKDKESLNRKSGILTSEHYFLLFRNVEEAR